MAKLTAVVLLLVALAAVARASAYTTVVTTTVTEESTNPRGQSCEREMQQKMPMRQCMMWMQKRMRGDAFLRSAVANPRFQEEHLQQCCGEIKQFSSGCRCDAVKEMMMDMPQMEEMARSLPSMCGLSECHFRA